MRVAPQPATSCVGLLAESPIVVAYGGATPAVVFDADALAKALGAAWPAVDRVLSETSAVGAHAALRALIDEHGLIAEAAGPLAEAEAALLAGGEGARAALAVIVLVLLQARISSIVEPA